MQPLAWELPYAAGVPLKQEKKKKKEAILEDLTRWGSQTRGNRSWQSVLKVAVVGGEQGWPGVRV